MNICRDCRHCKVVPYPDLPVAAIYCKRVFIIDYITGFVAYAECGSIRQHDNPHCPNWEQGGIKGFFQRLFKRK